MYTLKCELITTASLEETFAIFENPYNLAQITPPWLHFRILTPNLQMREGAEIDYEFRWLGVPLRWKTKITAYDPPAYFVDEAVKSPYKIWRHQHRLKATARGTVVADRVDYELPFGAIGRIAHAVSVSGQLKKIFSYRQQAIATLLDGSARQVSPPRITYSVETKA